MNILNSILNAFKYENKNEYNFVLSGNDNKERNISYSDENKDENKKENVFTNIDENLKLIKIKYNALINSDVVIREFSILAKNVEHKAFIVYIDGLVDSKTINDFVIKPLMMRNRANTFDDSKDGNNGSRRSSTPTINGKKVFVRKKENSDLTQYILEHLIPQNAVKKSEDFSNIVSGINSGNCALFVDSLDFAFDIDVKSFKERSVSAPTNEVVIKGPQEAFVENVRTNTSLLRRSVNNENLVIENIAVGKLSQTKCAVCYMKNIANSSLVAEVKYRLSNLDIDTLLSAGQLEQLIEETNKFGIPKIISTERPDKCTKALFEGRVVIIINGNPYTLVVPATFVDFISSPEDTNLRPQFTNFLKVIRILAMVITLLLPSVWIAVTSFHHELIPTELLFSIVASRENVPFPVIFEVILMEISFELIREASLRVPSAVGSTIGIVGALVLGEAAVSASIVSPILIIVIAITGISSFAIPDFSFGFHIRVMRFVFIIFGYIAGFLGIGLCSFIYICVLCSLKSFGVPYMVPFAPITKSKGSSYFVPSTYKQEQRPDYLDTKRPVAQAHKSMKWKNQ